MTSWVPGNPDATHVLNSMHVIFPEGERAFCRVLGASLGHITDDAVRRDIKGFLAQEGLHAQAHEGAMDHLLAATPHLQRAQHVSAAVFRRLLAGSRTKNRYLLRWQLASVAAIEHLTTAVGEWTMCGERLAEQGCDPEMVALIKWHGAEEIEHRSVAFDAHAAVQRRLVRATRVAAMSFWLPVIALLWAYSAQAMFWHDLGTRRRILSVRTTRRAMKDGLAPDAVAITRGALAFGKSTYHPSTHVPAPVVAAASQWLSNSSMLARTARSTTDVHGDRHHDVG